MLQLVVSMLGHEIAVEHFARMRRPNFSGKGGSAKIKEARSAAWPKDQLSHTPGYLIGDDDVDEHGDGDVDAEEGKEKITAERSFDECALGVYEVANK